MLSVLGIDQSIKGTGLCFIPRDWMGDQCSLIVKRIQLSDDYECASDFFSYMKIADEIVEFMRRMNPDCVVHEQFAYSRRSKFTTQSAELIGVIKASVWRNFSKEIISVSPNTARKHIIGKVKLISKGKGRGKKQKVQIRKFLAEKARMLFESLDEMDAFVIANWYYDLVNELEPRYKEATCAVRTNGTEVGL